jgi:predicted secreted Zn-dependent protease
MENKYLIILLTLLFPLLSFGEIYAGPFGTKMGQNKSEIEETITIKGRNTLYTSNQAPRMEPPMDTYIYKITPENGLCFVTGQTNNINIGENILEDLTNKYGEPVTDQKGRYVWGVPKHELDHNLKLVTFITPHTLNKASSVGVEFEYINNDKCSEEMFKAWGLR